MLPRLQAEEALLQITAMQAADGWTEAKDRRRIVWQLQDQARGIEEDKEPATPEQIVAALSMLGRGEVVR